MTSIILSSKPSPEQIHEAIHNESFRVDPDLVRLLQAPNEPICGHQADSSDEVVNLDDIQPISLSDDSPELQGFMKLFIAFSKPYFLKEKGGQEATDEEISQWLSDPTRAKANAKPRVEFRLVIQEGPKEYANIAFSFPTQKERDDNLSTFMKEESLLSVVCAGSTTIEIGVKGVNKATAIDAMTRHLPSILPSYTPGPLIDAMKYYSLLCMDADGTLWEKPKAGQDPTANHLGNSPTHAAILDYLRAGGVLAVISGNDPKRTIDRFMLGIPDEERSTLLPRVILSGAGGHTLMTYQKGEFKEFLPYRQTALTEQQTAPPLCDAIYLGDDPKVHGNDFPGFEKVGLDRAVCVTKKVNDEVESFTVPGETTAVRDVINKLLETRRLLGPDAKDRPLFSAAAYNYSIENQERSTSFNSFSSVPSLRSGAKAHPEAEATISETLGLIGREKVNHYISYSDQQVNAPVTYTRDMLNSLEEQKKAAPKEESPLHFDGLMKRGHHLNICTLPLGPAESSPKELLQALLEKKELQDGDVIRILEPGNNDQANPMHIAQQIKAIRAYAEKHKIRLDIQVLVMGQGGHATTATFHQFASVSNQKFQGIEEAENLGTTLVTALTEDQTFTLGENLQYKVEEFHSESAKTTVQIKLARSSRHTGMNVEEANQAFRQDPPDKKPKLLLVTSALTAATRQALTFAHQMEKGHFEELSSIPFARSPRFISMAFSDKQAVAEMYAGLAERARYYLYTFQENPFLPASAIDASDLENLYDAYSTLSQTGDLEKAKQVPIKEVLIFFQNQFQKLEKVIPWVEDTFSQGLATNGSISEMKARVKNKETFQETVLLYKQLATQLDQLTEEQRKTVELFGRLKAHIESAGSEREKLACLSLMNSLNPRLTSISQVVH